MSIRKVTQVLLLALILLGILMVVISYSRDSYLPVITPIPAVGITEADYLTRTNTDTETIRHYSLNTTFGLLPHFVKVGEGSAQGGQGVFLKRDGQYTLLNNSEDTIVILEGSSFHNGSIEVELKGRVSSNTPIINQYFSRGFVGICFRVDERLTAFECFYLRPENGFSEDPVRRSHAVQYISFPDWDFRHLREQAPGKYENPAPIKADTWHKLRIEVFNREASLFIDDAPKPVLTVNDLKLGGKRTGNIALWVGIGSEAFFKNLTIRTKK